MNMTERNYLHSRPLDVHRWSEHPEVNIFVDTIYNNDFRRGNENQRIKKQHLKLVLLDLYLAWFDDPDLNIGVHMSQSAYSNGKVFNKGQSRYNELNIKGTTIEIFCQNLDDQSDNHSKVLLKLITCEYILKNLLVMERTLICYNSI